MDNIKVIKKDGTTEDFNKQKIINAVLKSAERASTKLTQDELDILCELVLAKIKNLPDNERTIVKIHNIVEKILENINPDVAKTYRDYRNYKQDFVHMLDKVYQESQRIMYLGDVSNANADSSLVTTKRSLIFNELNKELYKKFFLTVDELQAVNEGYIYVHDMNARLNTTNCCVANVSNILKDGFTMANIKYTEPKTISVAFNVLSDVVMGMASNQYGGYSVSCIDTVLKPYAEKTYNQYVDKYIGLGLSSVVAQNQALIDVQRDIEQGVQGLELKWNTLNSSRGDYVFVTVSFGLDKDKFAQMITRAFLNVRKNGQGDKGNKKPVLFPKLIFLYDEKLHGEGAELEGLFDCAIECSKKAMYPDYISLSGNNYVSQMYKKYGKPITAMGCVIDNSLVTYKYKDKLYIESIKRLWDRMSKDFDIQKQQNNVDDFIIPSDLKIYDTKSGFIKVNCLNRNTQKEWVKIKIEGGRYLNMTDNHPLPTQRGRILAKDLQIGDKITINYNQYCENKENMSLDKAWLLGFMLCDGCYTKNSIFASIDAENEDDIQDKFINAMKNVYGQNVNIKIQDRRNAKRNKGFYKDLRVLSNGSYSKKNNTPSNLRVMYETFMEEFGGQQKKYRQIPNKIFSCNREVRLAFLAGMIDADGYLNNNGQCLQIGSTNEELALQQMALLQSVGLKSNVYMNKYGRGNNVRFYVESNISNELFNHIVCKKKKSHITKLVEPKNDYDLVEGKIYNVEKYTKEQYAYDVTTESDHFEVSGVYSHNCRSFLSPWYERGGMNPADENDVPIFEGRGNIGVISLNLPMIYMKSKQENKDFYIVLDYYLELIRSLHKRTFEYLGEMKASMNPLGFCEGGFYGGNLNPNDKIKPVLKTFTTSFGITALNELQYLYNKKSIAEDGEFALKTMKYIADKVEQFKQEDGILHSCYGTPAESLCMTQVEQFRLKYGIIENVSDREYMTNSFHCSVREDITPIEKQDLEGRFIDLCKGGQIFFTRFNCNYNTEAFKTIVRRAMNKGFYAGTNLNLSYCEDCGYEELDMQVCPKCGSNNITSISRVCGYLGYSRVNGDTRFNKGKLAECKDRVSY